MRITVKSKYPKDCSPSVEKLWDLVRANDMRPLVGDIWEYAADLSSNKDVPTVVVVVPVNDGMVCGRGLAKQAADKFPTTILQAKSIHPSKYYMDLFYRPQYAYVPKLHLMFFPVKEHYWESARVSYLTKGLSTLSTDVLVTSPGNCYLWPLLGCGFGNLKPEVALEVMGRFLMDQYVVIPQGVRDRYPQALKPGSKSDRLAE